MRYHYTLVAVIGHWRSGEGVPGDDADEVAWLTRAEIVDRPADRPRPVAADRPGHLAARLTAARRNTGSADRC